MCQQRLWTVTVFSTALARLLGRTWARCPDCSGSVSQARPPNPACPLLSAPALHEIVPLVSGFSVFPAKGVGMLLPR
jgi:hypothetical protein